MYRSVGGSSGPVSRGCCHAVHQVLPAKADDTFIRRSYDVAATLWWARAWGEARVWIEHIPAPSGSPAARGRLDAELHRPLSGYGPPIRVVVLRYSVGPADLVLVSDRRHLDYSSLALVAGVLSGRIDPESVSLRQSGLCDQAFSDEPTSGDDSLLDWAAPDMYATAGTGVLNVPLGAGPTDPAAAIAAAAGLTLARYVSRDTATIIVQSERADRPGNVVGGFEETTALHVDAFPSTRLTDIVCECAALLTNARPHAESDAASVIGILGTAPLSGYLPCQAAPFPITLAARPKEDGTLTLQVFHRMLRLGTESALQFARDVADLFQQMCFASPEATVGDLVVAAARSTGGSGGPSPRPRSTPQRIDVAFRTRAADQPDATALVHGEQRMTYAELNGLSDRFASALRGIGVETGERVGICLERSVDLVAAMLAVLKVGAVYVPMDVRHPAERLAYTATDAGLSVVVTDLSEGRWDEGVRLVRPDELTAHASVPIITVSDPGPEAPAYVIYTSGSTGRPKGVVVAHESVDALITATAAMLDLRCNDTWSFFHSSAFDFSVWEIWGALLTGATLVVVPYWITRSPVEFHGLLADESVTVLSQTPSAFAQLVSADRDLEELHAIRLVVFGGEPLNVRILRPWMDRYPESRCRLVNMYGITETTVHATAKTLTRRDVLGDTRSVGLPLSGWRVEVVDEQGRAVPVGVVGEIYVGGAGIALGYLNRADLTAQRFVVDPVTGRRTYRTGDLGRLRLDGEVEHLGRQDSQVKIRGFRIELDEIRNVLLDNPAVSSAAVVVGGDALDPAGLRIDAYVVASDQDSSLPVPPMIRRRAATFLPDYMVPTTVTVLPELPLTINGKLDTVRLPPPRQTPRAVAADGVRIEPGHRLAESLASIWESLLGVPVSLDNNLFELGGNSLAAIKADAMMRRDGLPVLPMRDLYLHPTIRGLCDTLTRRYPSSQFSDSPNS